MTEIKNEYKLLDVVEACWTKGTPLAVAQFSHPGDKYLFGVLVDLGDQYVTWVYNAAFGGFSHGHYFSKEHELNAHSKATEDFKTRFQ